MQYLYSGLYRRIEGFIGEKPDPDEETMRYWLAGNLCRCTGYDKIVRAVQDAAAEMSHPTRFNPIPS